MSATPTATVPRCRSGRLILTRRNSRSAPLSPGGRRTVRDRHGPQRREWDSGNALVIAHVVSNGVSNRVQPRCADSNAGDLVRSSVGRAVGSPPRTDLLRESIALPGPAASLSACSGAAEDTFSGSRLARQPDAPLLGVRVVTKVANRLVRRVFSGHGSHGLPRLRNRKLTGRRHPPGGMFWLRWNTLSGSQRVLTSERRR
jgi:hypothetical protein